MVDILPIIILPDKKNFELFCFEKYKWLRLPVYALIMNSFSDFVNKIPKKN